MGPLSGSNQAVLNQGNWNEDPPFSGHNNIGQLLDTQLETSAFNAYHPVKLIFVILYFINSLSYMEINGGLSSSKVNLNLSTWKHFLSLLHFVYSSSG